MDQGVIATAKAIYKKITFQKAHETHETLADFLKDYDVLQAVNNFANAWRQITRKNMRAVWNPLLKACQLVSDHSTNLQKHYLKLTKKLVKNSRDVAYIRSFRIFTSFGIF